MTTMAIQLRVQGRKALELEVTPSTTVADAKAMVQEKCMRARAQR